MSRRRRIALLVVVCAQLAVPLALAGLAAADLAFGEEIRLQAQPIDPIDVFRGNYVVLRYEISSLQAVSEVAGATRCAQTSSSPRTPGAPATRSPSAARQDDLRPGARNDAHAGETVGIEYGIETYYANAERAREIESSIASGQLYVVVDLDDDGSARIKRLEVGQ